VRDRSHWNASNIKPHSPVLLGLCKQADLDAALKRAQRRVARENAAKGIVEQPAEKPAHDGFVEQSAEQQPDIDHDAMMRGLG